MKKKSNPLQNKLLLLSKRSYARNGFANPIIVGNSELFSQENSFWIHSHISHRRTKNKKNIFYKEIVYWCFAYNACEY